MTSDGSAESYSGVARPLYRHAKASATLRSPGNFIYRTHFRAACSERKDSTMSGPLALSTRNGPLLIL